MVILSAQEVHTVDIDAMALRVFLKALELIGGPRKLIEYRNLTWLPSLMAAAYVVVLTEEAGKTEDEVAAFLGLTRNSVRNIRRADETHILQRLHGALTSGRSGVKDHAAGGLAKLAYREIKSGRGDIALLRRVVHQDCGGAAPPESDCGRSARRMRSVST